MGYVEEKFFEFPVKAYDMDSMIASKIREIRFDEEGEDDMDEETFVPHIDWVSSSKMCLPEDIIAWMETGDRGNKVNELAEEGFPRCTITIKENYSIATYECVWSKKKFEQKLNAFMSGRKSPPYIA